MPGPLTVRYITSVNVVRKGQAQMLQSKTPPQEVRMILESNHESSRTYAPLVIAVMVAIIAAVGIYFILVD